MALTCTSTCTVCTWELITAQLPYTYKYVQGTVQNACTLPASATHDACTYLPITHPASKRVPKSVLAIAFLAARHGTARAQRAASYRTYIFIAYHRPCTFDVL
ncbi:hypothetical protein DM02DRAFT_608319 [Periconia macrospinosa]|uniref:Uncharacterized protein n=1 Tax=Periconia macrospinosa TaxID=97972 RepID=A0A2V1EEW4_9PLEO|nr:hypothetical protein DM02DRAFT_608319 [Periconia macrospinosa]